MERPLWMHDHVPDAQIEQLLVQVEAARAKVLEEARKARAANKAINSGVTTSRL